MRRLVRTCVAALILSPLPGRAQLAPGAYRVLGQPDLHLNGLNMPGGIELRGPAGIALERVDQKLRLFVADSLNHRVLVWEDEAAFENNEPARVVLGQPGRAHVLPEGIGSKGLNTPVAVAVDPNTHHLYVADLNHHRVLRFPDPLKNPNRVEPDAVYGQPDFSTFTPNAGGVSNHSLNQPRALAFDSQGNLWVCDSGNHRVLRFPASALNSHAPAADLVLGQKDFTSARPDQGGTVSATGFNTPAGVVFDPASSSLYVADTLNARVLKFSSPEAVNQAAAAVWGQPGFTTRGVPAQAGPSSMAGPTALALDAGSNLYVAVPGENRVLVFSTILGAAINAREVLGQPDFTGTSANAGAAAFPSASTLNAPADVKIDSSGAVFVADSLNHRILRYTAGSKEAAAAPGQAGLDKNGPNRVKPVSVNAAFKMAVDYSEPPFALYISDMANHRVLAWRDSARFRNGDPADFVIGQPDLYTAAPNSETRTGPSLYSLSAPRGIATDAKGALWVADSGNSRVLRYPRPVSQQGRIAPDAVLGQTDFTSSVSAVVSASSLREPSAVAIGPDGTLFVADSGNHRVLEFKAGPGTGAAAERVFGQPAMSAGTAPAAPGADTLAYPQGLFVDASANLFVADPQANRVIVFSNTREAPRAGAFATTVLGQPGFQSSEAGHSARGLWQPSDVAVDRNGNIWVSDMANNRVLMFPPLIMIDAAGAAATGVLGQRSTDGTTANWNSTDRLATAEGMSSPVGIYLDRQDTLYVGDTGNNRVLHFLKPAATVNAAHYKGGVPVAAGTVAALFGAGLADTTASFTVLPLPASLAGREVVIDDSLVAPLYFVSPGQINFQVPSGAPQGTPRVAVRVTGTAEPVAGGQIAVAAASPALFSLNQGGSGQGAVLNANSTVNGPSNRAARGEIIQVFGTGLGAVSPAVPDGEAAPGQPLSWTVATRTSDGKACFSPGVMCVAVGSTFAEIGFSGLAPGMVGLWQLNVKIPEAAVTGEAVPIRAVVNSAPSNVVTVAIR